MTGVQTCALPISGILAVTDYFVDAADGHALKVPVYLKHLMSGCLILWGRIEEADLEVIPGFVMSIWNTAWHRAEYALLPAPEFTKTPDQLLKPGSHRVDKQFQFYTKLKS